MHIHSWVHSIFFGPTGKLGSVKPPKLLCIYLLDLMPRRLLISSRLEGAAFINFEPAGGGGIYLRAAFIFTFLHYALAVL